ncbi:MAG: ribosome small subunit-dependent GTPase A [Planctomycetota bacterium]
MTDKEKPEDIAPRERRTGRRKPPKRRDWTRVYREGRVDEMGEETKRFGRSEEEPPDQKTAAKFKRRLEPLSEGKLDEGIVKEVTSRWCAVIHEGKDIRCATRGTFKQVRQRQSNIVAVGDRVMFRMVSDTEGAVESVCERKTKLSRRHSFKDAIEHVMVANVDQLVIVSSVKQPPLKYGLIDRYTVAAENGGLVPVICINKIDLLGPDDERPDADRLYEAIGYDVIYTSATTGEGVERLRETLKDKMSVVAGHSGVGKSSLLNAVQPGLGLRVGRVMEDRHGKGRHTTERSTLVPLDVGGYVVDTPGIRAFGIWDVKVADLAGFLREFVPFAESCRFPGCSHTHEEGCKVKDAVEEGGIDRRRYENYLGIRDSL